MTRLAAAAACTWLALAARASEAPKDGVDALCLQVLRVAAPTLPGADSVGLELSAEGSALDLADAAAGRCAVALGASSRNAALHDRTVRVHLRVSPPQLVAMVEVLGAFADGGRPVLATEAVQVPLGLALGTWVTAGGTGLETWLVGAVDAQVLALCGDDSDGDGAPEVVFVTTSGLEVMRWGPSGLDPLAHVDLPASLRPRARAPGATVSCRAEDGALTVAFGIHDRNRGAIVRIRNGNAGPLTLLDGIPIGLPVGGEAPLATGLEGTGLVRWQGRDYASLALVPGAKGPAWRVAGATQDGVPVTADGVGRPMTVGSGVALADLDRDGSFEVVRALALLPGVEQPDRLLVSPLEDGASVRHESLPVKGAFGPLGAVVASGWWRVLAVQPGPQRSQVYALGRRLPVAAR